MCYQDRPAGQLLYRAARQVGVSFPRRVIELVVMPYDEVTLAEHDGRMVRESVAPGAFDGIERRANRIRVNRDHDVTRTVGSAIALHPSRAEGLVAELRIAQTPLGEETLTLADEELLDASAGFLPMPGGEEWLSRSERRFTRLWLGHVAMTPDPAYDGARVLAVRSSDPPAPVSATPGLDQVRDWLLRDRYAGL
jgi:HK97 family phage prohead protease